jgi:hypothetical protein
MERIVLVMYVWIYRWVVAETVYSLSSIKRMFGRCVSARKYSNMVKEMMLKASLLYNTHLLQENSYKK